MHIKVIENKMFATPKIYTFPESPLKTEHFGTLITTITKK